MYEPIRSTSVHTMAAPDFPRRSREEELDIRLATQLTALLTITDELYAATGQPGLADAARRIAQQVARLRAGQKPLRAAPTAVNTSPERLAALHQRAQRLAGHALAIASSRGDLPGATLAAERQSAHAEFTPLAAA